MIAWLGLLASCAGGLWFWATVEDERRRHRGRHQQARTRAVAGRGSRVWS